MILEQCREGLPGGKCLVYRKGVFESAMFAEIMSRMRGSASPITLARVMVSDGTRIVSDAKTILRNGVILALLGY